MATIIEEKARRYDEAKYIMKKYLESGNAGVIAENTIKKAFPELAESEDERIRKALMQNLKERFGTKGNMGEGLDMPDVLAWLEKQDEHANFISKIRVGDKVTRNEAGVLVNISQLNRIAKPMKQDEQKIPDVAIVRKELNEHLKPQVRTGLEWVNTIDDACDKRYSEEYAHGEYCHEQSFKWGFQEGVDWLEKQGKKPDYNVEPKFKQGDIIKEKETGNLFYVNSIEDFGYTLHYKDCTAKCCTMDFKYEDNYELVEQTSDWSEEDLPEFESYLCLMFQKFRTKGVCTNGEIVDFVKEHSQKLKDTLCHVWSEEDGEMIEALNMYIKQLDVMFSEIKIGDKDVLAKDFRENVQKWLKSLKDRVQSQPKQEWSEEDERERKRIIGLLEGWLSTFKETCYAEDCKCGIDWLKSLRPQKQWKPSDRDIKLLKELSDGKICPDNYRTRLYEIINNLKYL